MGLFGKKTTEPELDLEDEGLTEAVKAVPSSLGGNKNKEEKEEEKKEKVSSSDLAMKEEMEASLHAAKAINKIMNSDGTDVAAKGISMRPDFWGPLWDYIKDPEITDVDYNGKELWLKNAEGSHFKAPKEVQDKIDQGFINSLTVRMANEVSKEFNPMNPLLEAETPDLRISAVHESRAHTGRSFCVRKTPTFARITTTSALNEEYATKEQLAFLINCVKAHMNMAICGEPGVGKTEFCKYLSSFIPDNERVITIEDSLEWHYPAIHPEADCIELQVKEGIFSYFDAIKACLRQNPKWIMLSEARGNEVIAYLQQLSTGVNGLTTLHCDNSRKIPERFLNMCTDGGDKARMENDIYNFLNIGVYLNRHKNSEGEECRFLDQISVFGVNHDTDEKINTYLWSNGKPCFDSEEDLKKMLPKEVTEKFEKRGVVDLLKSEGIEKAIEDNA